MDEQTEALATLTSPEPEETFSSEGEFGSIEEELRAAILRKLRPPE